MADLLPAELPAPGRRHALASGFIKKSLAKRNNIDINSCITKSMLGVAMPRLSEETIPGLLVRNISRDVVLGVEEALVVGAQRAYAAAKGMDKGHLPHALGQLRHFHMNESFQRVLSVNDASPSPLRGNGIVTGRTGLFKIARFNISSGIWANGRRSQTRRQMSLANKVIEPLVQPGIFEIYVPPSEAVAFFAACFSGSPLIQPESPVSIQIAVPDRYMQYWLFKERVADFVMRYDRKTSKQDDLAIPKLKVSIDKQLGKDGTA